MISTVTMNDIMQIHLLFVYDIKH